MGPKRFRLFVTGLALLGCLGFARVVVADPGSPIASRPSRPGEAWPTFKGDNARDGRGADLGLPVTVAWTASLKGSLYSSPAIQGGRVYLGSSAERVYCLDLKTGATLWQSALPDRVWGSSPALARGRLYIGCVDGCIHVLDAMDGSALGSVCAPDRPWFGRGDVLSAPMVQGTRLVFGSDDHNIYGVDLSGGSSWKEPTGGKLHDNGAAEEAGLVVIASRDETVRALGLSDGSLRWIFQGGGAFNTVPALDAQRAYIGCADGRLYALDLDNGGLAWSYATGHGIMSSPALGRDGSVVFGCSDGTVYCLDAATGARRWVFHAGSYVLSSPLITGALVWIGSFGGSFYALSLNDGRALWHMNVPGGVFASPACASGRILVAGRDGFLACLKATPEPPF